MSKQDSSLPDFWDQRYQNQVMPWDTQGKVPSELQAFVEKQSAKLISLIPGCGSGYELLYLHEAGWPVLGIDFSESAVIAAQQMLGAEAALVQRADFFTLPCVAPTYDFIYERAFLCALPPRCWSNYASKMASLVVPEGILAGYFFLKDSLKGPPFGTNLAALEQLLSPYFQLKNHIQASESLPVFQEGEYWMEWRRVSAR